MRHLEFHLVQPFEAESAFSAATVGHPYKMCVLDLSALQFAIRRLGSKTLPQNALCIIRASFRDARRESFDFRNLRIFPPARNSTRFSDLKPTDSALAIR